MQDFVTPLEFLREPVMDYSLQPDTLRCNRSVGNIVITNNTTIGNYSWKTTNGNIITSNADSSQININKTGTYIVSASPAVGCPVTRTDTVVIKLDTFPPVASIIATIGSNFSYLQFYGGDVNASNYATPFGGSQGLLWNWSGPGGFASTIQNPTNDTAWGTYQLIVTEKRNGCKDTIQKPLSFWDFGVLAGRFMNLSGIYANQSIRLNWRDRAESNVDFYEIEKSSNSSGFNKIGTVFNSNTQGSTAGNLFTFTDNNPNYGDNLYRVKSTSKSGQVLYSNIVNINADMINQRKIYLIKNIAGNGVSLVCNFENNCNANLITYNIAGQMLQAKNIQLSKGLNVIEVPWNANLKNSVIVVSLYVNNQLTFTQKALY